MAVDRREPSTDREMRKPSGMLIQYRGGPEAFWSISYAGRTIRVPGWMALHDAMLLAHGHRLADGSHDS